jgi:hypothetical protein
MVDGVHLVVEVPDTAGKATDHHICRMFHRVGTFAGPHPGCFRHQAGLVSALETGPDLVGTREHDLAELVQRFVALTAG